MFWIGLIVGIIIAIIASVGFAAYCCKKVYGDRKTFMSMVDVTRVAAENRESEVQVYHDGELLKIAFFEEL
jgi:H+/gluconate symporter-like permease